MKNKAPAQWPGLLLTEFGEELSLPAPMMTLVALLILLSLFWRAALLPGLPGIVLLLLLTRPLFLMLFLRALSVLL